MVLHQKNVLPAICIQNNGDGDFCILPTHEGSISFENMFSHEYETMVVENIDRQSKHRSININNNNNNNIHNNNINNDIDNDIDKINNDTYTDDIKYDCTTDGTFYNSSSNQSSDQDAEIGINDETSGGGGIEHSTADEDCRGDAHRCDNLSDNMSGLKHDLNTHDMNEEDEDRQQLRKMPILPSIMVTDEPTYDEIHRNDDMVERWLQNSACSGKLRRSSSFNGVTTRDWHHEDPDSMTTDSEDDDNQDGGLSTSRDGVVESLNVLTLTKQRSASFNDLRSADVPKLRPSSSFSNLLPAKNKAAAKITASLSQNSIHATRKSHTDLHSISNSRQTSKQPFHRPLAREEGSISSWGSQKSLKKSDSSPMPQRKSKSISALSLSPRMERKAARTRPLTPKKPPGPKSRLSLPLLRGNRGNGLVSQNN